MRALPFVFLAAACSSTGGTATLENDGSWVQSFAADPETLYHATLQALLADGYEVERTNPLGGSIVARSPIRQSGLVVRYTIARVDIEGFDGSSRARLGLTETHEPSGAGRRPNNDRPVRDRGEYEAFFGKIRRALP